MRLCWSDDASVRPSAPALLSDLSPLSPLEAGETRPLWADEPESPQQGTSLLSAVVEGGGGEVGITDSPNGPAATELAAACADCAQPAVQMAAPEALGEISTWLGASAGIVLRVGVEATAGKRGADRMEDAHTLCSQPGVCLAAVFDGHGGDACARFAGEWLPSALLRALPNAQTALGSLPIPLTTPPDWSGFGAIQQALADAFVCLNDDFLSGGSADDSGCTALAAVCLNLPGGQTGKLLVANAGDCQCCLWRGDELLTVNEVPTTADAISPPHVPQPPLMPSAPRMYPTTADAISPPHVPNHR